MTDTPETLDEQNAIHHALGASIGSAAVAMLFDHSSCNCVRCQLNVLRWATRWALHGNDMRDGLPAVEDLIRDLHTVRRLLRQQVRFNTAMGEHMQGAPLPPTEGKPN